MALQVCTAVKFEAASLQALLDVNGLAHVSQLLQWLSLASAHSQLGEQFQQASAQEEHALRSMQQDSSGADRGLDERRRSGRYASTSEGAVVSFFFLPSPSV